jgi:hypothetical protein
VWFAISSTLRSRQSPSVRRLSAVNNLRVFIVQFGWTVEAEMVVFGDGFTSPGR